MVGGSSRADAASYSGGDADDGVSAEPVASIPACSAAESDAGGGRSGRPAAVPVPDGPCSASTPRRYPAAAPGRFATAGCRGRNRHDQQPMTPAELAELFGSARLYRPVAWSPPAA
jgi:hypothetical protein